MDAQNDNATARKELLPRPAPSHWWCKLQGLKGTNFRRLSIPDVDLRHKWIILTGGNSGVGLEAALQFVGWGANIILGCRKPPPHEMHPDVAVQNLKAAALAAGYQDTVIEWWECDMASLKGVEAFGKRWLEKDRPLDILANNAGMTGVLSKVQYTCDGFEIVHQVRKFRVFTTAMDANQSPGQLSFSCSSNCNAASIFGTIFATTDNMHDFMYAVLWRIQPG